MSESANFTTADELDFGGAAWGAGYNYFTWNEDQRKQWALNQMPESREEAMATNASTLERDEYETLTDRIIQTYKRELVGLDDLRSEGLVRNISLATQVDLWQTVTEGTEAEISMDGESQGENDRVMYDTQGAPVPIIFKDFRIPQRMLQTSRNMGNDLRTDFTTEFSRSVAEMANQVLFQGWNPTVNTARGDDWQLYGYTDSAVAASVSGSDFGTEGNIRDVFVSAVDKLLDDNNQSPAGDGLLPYISQTQYRQYRNAIDPDGDGNMTVRQRIEDEFDAEIQEPRSVPDYVLPDGEMVMVNPTPDVVEFAEAEGIQTIEWSSGSGMSNFYKIMMAGAPELKVDANGNKGIVHVTGI